MLTLKKKFRLYRRTDGLYIYCFYCLFAWIMIFKDMDFSRPFQAGFIQVTFISGNKNDKSNDFFLSYFPIHKSFLVAWSRSCSDIFWKLTGENGMTEFVFSNAVGLITTRENFLQLWEEVINSLSWLTTSDCFRACRACWASELADVFSLNFSTFIFLLVWNRLERTCHLSQTIIWFCMR